MGIEITAGINQRHKLVSKLWQLNHKISLLP